MITMSALMAIAVPIAGCGIVMADDLKDGISKFTDESVAKDDELGEKDPNLSYIMLKAKAKGSSDGVVTDGANMNSVVVGPGSSVKGPIIIIDQSKGPKTQVVDN
jgi:hypothetical protein